MKVFSIVFCAKNIVCGHTFKTPLLGGSNEYPQSRSIFLERLCNLDLCFFIYNYHVYPCKPQFYYIKVGCKGVYIIRTC